MTISIKGIPLYFQYSGCISGDIDLESAETVIGLKIMSLTGLNDCPAGSNWAVSMVPTGSHVDYHQILSSADCQPLTVTWSVGSIGECSAATTDNNDDSGDNDGDGDIKCNNGDGNGKCGNGQNKDKDKTKETKEKKDNKGQSKKN